MKHQVDDLVMIYKDSPTFKDGSLGKIIERDPHDKSYLVAPLEDVLKCEGDIGRLLECGKWVKSENFKVLNFEKPKKWVYFIGYPLMFLLGLGIAHFLKF